MMRIVEKGRCPLCKEEENEMLKCSETQRWKEKCTEK
jgi:hypothetical protein